MTLFVFVCLSTKNDQKLQQKEHCKCMQKVDSDVYAYCIKGRWPILGINRGY